jgi:hypothetical protein
VSGKSGSANPITLIKAAIDNTTVMGPIKESFKVLIHDLEHA